MKWVRQIYHSSATKTSYHVDAFTYAISCVDPREIRKNTAKWIKVWAAGDERMIQSHYWRILITNEHNWKQKLYLKWFNEFIKRFRFFSVRRASDLSRNLNRKSNPIFFEIISNKNFQFKNSFFSYLEKHFSFFFVSYFCFISIAICVLTYCWIVSCLSLLFHFDTKITQQKLTVVIE